MRKIGLALLGVWTALNFVVALYVTIATVTGHSPPALRLVMSDAQIANVDPSALAVINAQAAIANPLIMAVCAFVVVLLVRARHERWAIATLGAILVPVQLFGFVSDAFLGGTAMTANLVSSVVLLGGLAALLKAARPSPS
ncbi:MAG: hypothetical protein QM817_16905 [Archangium sp.]